MAKRQFQLTDKQVSELKRAYANCKDGATRTATKPFDCTAPAIRSREIMHITGCSRSSLMDWCRQYRSSGIDGLVDKRVGGNRAKLTPDQLEDLQARLHSYTPSELFGATAATADGQFWTLSDLQRAIEQWYGVCYQSPSSYPRLFHLCGFSYQRPAKVYKSRSEAKIAEFEEQLEKNSSIRP